RSTIPANSYQGDSLSGKRRWQVARLENIERRGRDILVREHLGIRAFGINAYTPGEDGTLITEHEEAESGQEELYIVLHGNATFAHLRRSVELLPRFRERARRDDDFAAVRDDPRFEEALR